MSIRFDISLRNGGAVHGRLRWAARNLDSPAVSGPHGNGALPDGLYLVRQGTCSDRAGQAPYCDSLQNCWFQFVEPQFSTPRTDLGVHPDGNVTGTQGCIGLLDADSSEWRRAFETLSADERLEVGSAAGPQTSSPGAHVMSQPSEGAWPGDTQEALEQFYGRHELSSIGQPTRQWEQAHLVTVDVPYRLTLAWDLTTTIRRVRCHARVADSLRAALERILAHYGSIDEVRRARMHLFGGCYQYRPVAGGSRLSTHAWGAAVDLDPERNPLGKAWDPRDGMMPQAVVAIFEAEGWKWGGRFGSRPDCMHFQATA